MSIKDNVLLVDMEDLESHNGGHGQGKPKLIDQLSLDEAYRMDLAERLDVEVSLHQLARDGDTFAIEKCLDSVDPGQVKKKLDAKDESHLTPLHYAARHNHFTTMRLLVERGADVNSKGEDGITPLHFAARCRRSRNSKPRPLKSKSEDLVPISETVRNRKNKKHRLAAGNSSSSAAEVREEADSEGDGEPETDERKKTEEVATAESIITYLVDKGAFVNQADMYGLRPLHYAALRGNEVVAAELLRCPKINPNAEDGESMTPLHAACAHGAFQVARLLLESDANVQAIDEQHNTPLHLAAQDGYFKIVKLLMGFMDATMKAADKKKLILNKNYEENTPLHLAVDSGHYDISKMLIDAGSNVNMPRKLNETPLHGACMTGEVKLVEMLLDCGARIDAKTDTGDSPLHTAAAYNKFDICKFLVDRGAKMGARNRDSATPFLIAATEGHEKCVKVLMKEGADISAVDKMDKTCCYLAAEYDNTEVIKVLLDDDNIGNLVNQTDRYNNTPLHIAAQKGHHEIVLLLLENQAVINAKNEEEFTPLHLAAKEGRTRVVRELVAHHKLAVTDEDEESNTPLHLAATGGHEVVVRELLWSGANVTARNAHLWTPVDCAAAAGWPITVQTLLDYGAPIDPVDKTKTTPFHLSCREGHLEVVELLLKRGACVNLLDHNGHNGLDLAIFYRHRGVCEVIINHKDWRLALQNSRLEAGKLVTPLRSLIINMPEVAKLVFDRCTTTNGLPSDRHNHAIIFDYDFIEDAYSLPEEVDDSGNVSPWVDDTLRLRDEAVPYCSDRDILMQDHPFMVMVDNQRESLLGHPLIMSLLRWKWNSIGRYIYYSTLLIYIIFLAFYTIFVVETTPPFIRRRKERGEPINGGSTTFSPSVSQNCTQLQFEDTVLRDVSVYALLFVLVPINLLREFYQMFVRRTKYISFENFAEMVVYISAFLVCLPIKCHIEDWQFCLAAVTICIAWLNLILFLRKFPRFGIYVVMFIDVFRTFSRIFVVFFLFIVAFALTFHMVLQDQPSFARADSSLLRTAVMMVGEYEYVATFEDYTVNYPYVSFPMFALFVIIMTIILMNLLVGLAVDDIKEVLVKAKLKKLAMQVQLVLEVEMSLPPSLRRRHLIRVQQIYPNRMAWYSRLLMNMWDEPSALSVVSIAKAHNQEKTEYENLSDSQQALGKQVGTLERRVRELAWQNSQLQSMMRAMMRSMSVEWEDEDHFA